MRNSYEMSEVFELGSTKEEILGSKPRFRDIDGIFGTERLPYTLPDDIDESDD